MVLTYMMLRMHSIDFSMCNPPFYESRKEMLDSAAAKLRVPFTACTGSENEMVTPGGEVAFVSRMIEESMILQGRVEWYTSMLGKFSSVSILVQKLRDQKIDNYAVTEFVQGSKTRRWGIAWSFEDLRPSTSVARGVSSLQKALLPFPSEYLINVSNLIPSFADTDPNQLLINPTDVGQRVNATLSQLPLKWQWKANISTGVGFSSKAVWSRASRRHVAKNSEDAMDKEEDEEDMAFGFGIRIEANPGGVAGCRVTMRWFKGHDSVLFESFCGMLKRKIEEVKK
jgi:23S rRNA (adenine1618-N6)-methyltransferase